VLISLVSAFWNVSDLDSNLVCAAVFMLGRERSAIVHSKIEVSHCVLYALKERAIVFLMHSKKKLLQELIVSFFESDKEG
jgi:hypothetical protein